MPQHKDLNIWIETDRGAQHWQRAALGFSILSGFFTGVFAFSLTFHTVRVPIANEDLGLALSSKDAKTHLAHELSGYFSDTNGANMPLQARKSIILAKNGGIIAQAPQKTVLITSLFPQSYISTQNTLIPTHFAEYGLEFRHHAQKTENSSPQSDEFITISSVDSAFSIPNLRFSKWEQLPHANGISISGEGEEKNFIQLLSQFNRPITINATALEDGTPIKEIRAPSQKIGISSTSNITTYINVNPYLLATYNKQEASWTLRTAPSEALDPHTTPDSVGLCPSGTQSEITNFKNDSFGIEKFVMATADKLVDAKQSTYLCIAVDKL